MTDEEEFLQEFYDIKLTEKSCATCNFYMTPSYCDIKPVCKERSKWVKTEITNKEQLVEYILSLELEKGNKILQTREVIEAMLQAYVDGLNKGRQKWHDLRKDPQDLPKEIEIYSMPVYIVSEHGNSDLAQYDYKQKLWCYKYSNEHILYDVAAWCELPKFEE